MTSRITSEEDAGRIHFKINFGGPDDLQKDVVLEVIDSQTVDRSLFGMSSIPQGLIAYDVETNAPKLRGRALWQASHHTLWIWNPDRGASQHVGTLDACILQAYNDGTLCA